MSTLAQTNERSVAKVLRIKEFKGAATEIMNRRGALEIEKISASRPELLNTDHGEDPPVRALSVKPGEPAPPARVPVCLSGNSITEFAFK